MGLVWHDPPSHTHLASSLSSASNLLLLLLPLFLPPRSAPAALDRSVTQTQKNCSAGSQAIALEQQNKHEPPQSIHA
jgi:hypothetical protein